MLNYLRQFVGVLGWVDAPLSKIKYYILIGLGSLILIFSVKKPNNKLIFLLEIIIFLSVLLGTYFILLLTWTPLQSDIIRGVQGRYFIPIALIFSYMFYPKDKFLYFSNYMAFLSLVLSSVFTISTIMYRYLLG